MDYIILAISALCLVLSVTFFLIFSKKLSGLGEAGDRDSDVLKQKTTEISARQDMLVKSVESLSFQTEQKLDNVRSALQNGLTGIREDTGRQLENIKKTVDEKLQESLDKKLTQSFMQVSTQLEQVYKGLGEMQAIASGVGDLKKVLSNVKTRGILGEIQLGSILEQILSPQQYDTNVATFPGASERVEYAVKLPGSDGESVYLPIDAKFPADAYSQLLDAYEKADPELVGVSLKTLTGRIKSFARDIHEKYVKPPFTTDFAIMFLPIEGLYAELVRAGMVEELQSLYKINIAGPTTMGALLNSLQMGFRTLAIQKRSGEVWKILSNVKTEFESFESVLASTQKQLFKANEELDKLVGTRTRKIMKALKDVEVSDNELPPSEDIL